ncbi:MAG: response regulator [bacterium]
MAKILIVDDDRYIIDVVKVALEIQGYEIIDAFDGEEALAKTIHEFPDLILLDLLMPKMDGWEVYEQLKGETETAHIPIIIISALSEETSMPERMEVEDYIAKPFEMNDLLNRVKKSLEKI